MSDSWKEPYFSPENTEDRSEITFLRHQQKAIAGLAETFLRGDSSKELFDNVSLSLQDVLKADGSLLLMRSYMTQGFLLLASCGLCDEKELELTPWLENAQIEESLKNPHVVAVSDYQKSSRYTPPDRACMKDFRAGICIQIPGNPDPQGVIAVYRSNPVHFTEQEQEFLKTIAFLLAGALSRDSKEQALRESEALSKAILKSAVDGIVTIDDVGSITLFNHAAQEMFGYSEEEVLGKNVKILMPEPYQSEHDQYLDNYKSTGAKKIIGIGREMTGLRKDGTTFPLYLAVSEFKMGNKRHFTGIVRDITKQRSLEQEVLQISDHERRRIGQDLHDGLGQMLTGIGLMSQGLQKKLKKESSAHAGMADEITSLIRDADQYAKHLSRGLLPVDFDVRGLATSLERLAANAERMFSVECTFMERETPVFYDNTVVEHLFRIAQEAISNSVKHGQPEKIRIELSSNKDFAMLKIQDDGKGFSSEWQQKQGSGIDIMRFRAQLIGANLDITNMPGGGVELVCKLPRTEAIYRRVEEQE